MKRILLSLLAGIAVFGAVFGFAAAITPTSDNLGAGDATVAACGDNAVVHYETSWDATAKQYYVDAVSVTGLTDCLDGDEVTVTLTNGTARLGDAAGTVASGVTGSMSVGENVEAEDVTNADVIVHSPGSETTPNS